MAIQEVIKYEGDNSTLIYKHPAEDFNTLSQLIVHESQEAVFFSDGQALDSFKAGRYTLETKNIPLISKIRNLVSGGVSPFHVEVYFINLATMMDIAWGTPSQQCSRRRKVEILPVSSVERVCRRMLNSVSSVVKKW